MKMSKTKEETKESMCPNCFKTVITHKPNDETSCIGCGQKFKIVKNRLKFK